MASGKYLCLHGHFYQPPRENPWIEAIEPQESARPFHDWNEKIHQECYLPNARARVLDEKGRVVEIVNNYKQLNFNFGPTLLAWLEEKHPDTYQEILAADKASLKSQNGHGNAIAQVYNHMIMPLANERDKVTQVRWGISEFRFRFKRDPESIWLAETACNQDTLEVLIEHGMKYLILAPHQAEAVKPLGGSEWSDVSNSEIDPKQPYRCFSTAHPGKFIDIFFYDGPIAKAAGFENLLYDAKHFMQRIQQASVPRSEAQLISAATDGETFGHHKAFGERVIAYLLNVEAPKQGFEIMNYGNFLAKFPPTSEVRIKSGENGEGTSWSCAHGVRRWKDNCGCRGGGPGEWSQQWRAPLREALDWLRDYCARIYEDKTAGLLKDAWEARNDYIHVILDRREANVNAFFERHAARTLNEEERIFCLKLFEMQRHTLLMYTSCGWFFTELSGIETVKVIEYAARAVQLAQEISGSAIEDEFLNLLSKAKSNVPLQKDGRHIYETMVRPLQVGLNQAAGFYAIRSLIDETVDQQEIHKFYCFKVQVLQQQRESFGDMVINFGRLQVSSVITEESRDLIFIAIHMGLYDFRCSMKPFTSLDELEQLQKAFFDELHSTHLVELMRMIDRHFGEKYYSLKDLPKSERMEIIFRLTREMIHKISQAHEHLFDENRRMSEIYRMMNLPIPEEIRYAAEHTLKKRMEAAIQEIAEQGFNPKKITAIQRVIESAKSFEVDLPLTQIAAYLSAELSGRTAQFAQKPSQELLTECLNIQKIAKKIQVELSQSRSQEHLFHLVKRWIASPAAMPAQVPELAGGIQQLLTDLHIHTDEFKTLMQTAVK